MTDTLKTRRDLTKLRDELVDKYDDEKSGSADRTIGFCDGFDAALQALAQMAPSFDSKTEFELSKKDYPSEENESQRIVSTIAAGAQNAGKNLMHQRLVPIIKAKDIQIATLRAELGERDALLIEIRNAWNEHQRTKFLSDGSHFQADIKLNYLLTPQGAKHE